jgi:hypothetical protein
MDNNNQLPKLLQAIKDPQVIVEATWIKKGNTFFHGEARPCERYPEGLFCTGWIRKAFKRIKNGK